MKLNGWTWLMAGVIISAFSGYIYLFVPKDGKPNAAMALFFFIGIIFIVVGIAKIFFRRMDDKSVMDSIQTAEQTQPKIVTLPNNVNNTNNTSVESRPNRIDETIAEMAQQEQQPQARSQTQRPVVPINVINPNVPVQNVQKADNHSNTFSKIYEYKGPVHTPSTGTHAQHPVSQHTQQHTAQHQTTATNVAQQHHSVQNTTEHSIKCRKCGNVNSGSSNYCHQCGNRLK